MVFIIALDICKIPSAVYELRDGMMPCIVPFFLI